MTQQNAPKCPRCGSDNKQKRYQVSQVSCIHDWHGEPAAPQPDTSTWGMSGYIRIPPPAAPPEGETMLKGGMANCGKENHMDELERLRNAVAEKDKEIDLLTYKYDTARNLFMETNDALVQANRRAEKAEAELARLSVYETEAELGDQIRYLKARVAEMEVELARLREQIEVLKQERQWNFEHGFNQ